MKVVIIGAGPSGLVTCKTFLSQISDEYPFDPVVLEQEDNLGGTFRYRSYENANLVSSKQLTSFTDFRLPLDHPDHLTLPGYVDYLSGYVDHFGFRSRINFLCKVVKVSRLKASDMKGPGHLVEYIKGAKGADGEVYWEEETRSIRAAYVAVCSGLHVIPSIPEIPGIQHIGASIPQNEMKLRGPQVFHSDHYKQRSQLSGRKVMILGTGETGMDLAYESVKADAKEVVLCTRSGFLSFPKVLNDFEIFGQKFNGNLPIDGLITNLFETTYVHPWVARSHLRWFVSDFVVKRVLWLVTGTSAGCNQWVGELDYERLGRAYVFLNKSSKAMPYINRKYRVRPKLLDYLSRYIDPVEDSDAHTKFSVDLAPFPSAFTEGGSAVFPLNHRKESKRMQGRDFRPDTVIFATGYRQDFSMFDPAGEYPKPDEADIRGIYQKGDPTVSFIGFLRPGVGAIPPISEMQAMLLVAIITGKVSEPVSEPFYHLLQKKTARITYGVDHSAYISTVARDLGAVPGLWELVNDYGLHVMVCYSFGAAMTPFYRLYGPYRSASAPGIVKTEIWETITRRGLIGNFAMGVIPMIFYGIVNLIALIAETGLRIVTGRPAAM